MPTRKILATKILPTVMIGEKIAFSTRNFKDNRKPPYQSIDCGVRFKKYVTDDTTDAMLMEDYNGNICEDIIEIKREDLSLPDFTLLIKKGNTLNAYRINVLSTNCKLSKEASLYNKSGRHKATSYNITDFTICSILQEEKNIFNSKNIDKLRELKFNEQITNDGYLIIEE